MKLTIKIFAILFFFSAYINAQNNPLYDLKIIQEEYVIDSRLLNCYVIGNLKQKKLLTKTSKTKTPISYSVQQRKIVSKPKLNLFPQEKEVVGFVKTSGLNNLVKQKDTVKFYDLNFKQLHKVDFYKTNKQHTLIVELTNKGDQLELIKQDVILPKNWKLVSLSSVNSIKKNGKKLLLISFFIPSNFPAGQTTATIRIKNNSNKIIGANNLQFIIAKNASLNVFNIYAPQHVEAGKLIESSFAVENKGNVTQVLNLTSRNTIVGKNVYSVAPDSTIVVKLHQKTNSKTYSFRRVGTGIEVASNVSKEVLKSYKSVSVFPIKIKQKDPYFRFPIRASLYYNSYSSKEEHYAAMSAEVAGNGYLDVDRKHNLDFIIRGPKDINRKRFSVVDQYSLIYSYKDKTKIYLGDHAYQINRLGFTNKYGMGFKIDQRINNMKLSVFYTKPRLYDFNSGAIYGAQATFYNSKKLSTGVSITRSEEIITNNRATNNSGQIITANLDFRDKSTTILGEVSASFNNQYNFKGAAYLSVSKNYKNLRYFGNYIVSEKNYLGAISNSLQLSNNLSYAINRFTLGAGYTISKINKKLDPLFYATEPFYENINANLNYRFSNNNIIQLSVYNRKRKDMLVPKNYDYKEQGIKYSYNFRTLNNLFSGNFNGRLAKTRNLLSSQLNYRNTYANNFNASYRVTSKFNVRAKFSHNYNNRYGYSNTSTHFYRYGAGFSYNFSRKINFNANYNSGFSPEKSYLKRDFLNVNLMAKISNNHQLEFRANYFENPGEINKKQVLVFAKYTYSFGAPLKKIIKQGGLIGNVFSLDKNINTKGIKIIAAGKTVLTDKYGNFELNNLSLGKNYILVDQSTLENGVITSAKIPYEVSIKDNSQANIRIELVKSASLKGVFWIDLTKVKYRNKEYNLQGYIKIQNKDFTYYTSLDKNGEFKFQEIVPGNYKLTVLSFSSSNAKFTFDNNIQIQLNKDEVTSKKIELKLAERKIKFKNKNFKIIE